MPGSSVVTELAVARAWHCFAAVELINMRVFSSHMVRNEAHVVCDHVAVRVVNIIVKYIKGVTMCVTIPRKIDQQGTVDVAWVWWVFR